MAATLWFYVRDDKRQGPVDFEQLVTMLLAGQIPHNSLLWHQGLQEWAEADKIVEIAEQLPPGLPEDANLPAAVPSGPSRVDELRKRLEKEPDSRLFAQLAEELRKDGQLEEAIAVCRTGLQKHPNYPSARITLGRALIDSGDLAGARAELETVLQGAPDNILARQLLDECVVAMGGPSVPAAKPTPNPSGKWWKSFWDGAGAPIPLAATGDEPFELAAPYEGPVVGRPSVTGSGDTGPLTVAPPASAPTAPPPLAAPPPPPAAAAPAAPQSLPPPGRPARKAPAAELSALLEDEAPAPRMFVPSQMPPTGSLADTDFPDLIHGLHERRWTGTIQLNRGRMDSTVTVKDGRLIFATSTNRDERLGELLLRTEKITLQRYYESGKAIRKGKRLGSLLVEQGALEARDLVKAVVDHTQEVIYGVFQWTEGFYRLREGADPDTETITLKLSTANIILEGIRRITAWSRVERGIGGPDARYVRAEDYEDRLPEMTLTPEKVLLLTGHEGERDVDTMCRGSELSDFEVCRTIWAFRVIGVLKQVPAASPRSS